jgi:hypothetical protein
MHGIKSNSKIWTLDSKLLKVIPERLKYPNHCPKLPLDFFA